MSQKRFGEESWEAAMGILSDRIRCVAAIVVSSTGQVMLQQRNQRLEDYPGHWALVGGHVKSMELPEDTVKRELMEQAGLDVAFSFWKIYPHPVRIGEDMTVTVEQHLFVASVDDERLAAVPKVHPSLALFERSQLADLPFAFQFREVVEQFFSHWEA
jgi:8-oxo-dGTP pyrophosphatase MutT (NUDIX family)